MTLFAHLFILKLGGSLKKYNRIDCNWMIVSIVLPMLMFFLSMASVYAYFTATATKKESELTTAIIRVGFTDDTAATISSNSITDSSRIVPGETLKISGAVQNIGNSDIYTIIHYELFTQKVNEEEIQIVDKYYTFDGSTMVEIAELTSVNNSHTESARTLTADKTTMLGETVNFNLNHKFDFYEYDNTYQNGTVRYLVTAHAIQVANIDDAELATNLLMDNISTNNNLFDPTITLTNGYYDSTGAIINATDWSYTDYIAVDGYSFTISNTSAGYNPSICAYDADKNFITGVKYRNKSATTIESTTKIKYLRFSIPNTADLNEILLIENI